MDGNAAPLLLGKIPIYRILGCSGAGLNTPPASAISACTKSKCNIYTEITVVVCTASFCRNNWDSYFVVVMAAWALSLLRFFLFDCCLFDSLCLDYVHSLLEFACALSFFLTFGFPFFKARKSPDNTIHILQQAWWPGWRMGNRVGWPPPQKKHFLVPTVSTPLNVLSSWFEG